MSEVALARARVSRFGRGEAAIQPSAIKPEGVLHREKRSGSGEKELLVGLEEAVKFVT